VAVADISFRSITDVALHILALTNYREGVFLLKPQFEWREPPKDFDGVVRRDQDLLSIMTDAITELSDRGVLLQAAVESPLRGRLGNREYLLHAYAPCVEVGFDDYDRSAGEVDESQPVPSQPTPSPQRPRQRAASQRRAAPHSIARLLVTDGVWTGSG
jgi:hypothetical protein